MGAVTVPKDSVLSMEKLSDLGKKMSWIIRDELLYT